MPSMRMCLSKNPFIQTYSFTPGNKINIQVNFESGEIPERHRLQILDHKYNSRLNRYGGGSKINLENWPIPLSIRDDHFGIWFIKVDDISNRSLENNNILGILKQVFFVEKETRGIIPVLGEKAAVEEQIKTIISETGSEDLVSIQERIDSQVGEVFLPADGESPLKMLYPVTDIRGIGKTYADRLKKKDIETVSDFWYYQDRVALAEIMRINDKRLEKMLQEAEIILSEEADRRVSIELEESGEIIPDDLRSVKGLDTKTIKKLKVLGIRNKSDLLDFDDISILRDTLNTSREEFRSILASVGKIIEPDDVKKPITLEVINQSVMSVKGIGKVTAQKLNSIGILTVQDLIESNFEGVKQVATKNQFEKWVENASNLLGKPVKIKSIEESHMNSTNELLSLPGIGPKTLAKLSSLNINSKAHLVEFVDQEKLRRILRMSDVRFHAFMESIKLNK